MSKPLIQSYYNQLDRSFDFSKTKNEETIKSYFWMLLNDYAHRQNYEVVREVFTMGTKGAKVRPDGILKNLWGIEIGLWESKDEKDDIEAEIDAKQKKGYPLTNILFEDSLSAVLFQRGELVRKVSMRDEDALDKIIKEFVSFKNETIYKFEDAIEKFKADIPTIVEAFRKRIEEASAPHASSPLSATSPLSARRKAGGEAFIEAREVFLKLCQAEINPAFTLADVREMMIQHILTSDIFNRIFDDPDFHRHNTIAAELEKLISTLFTYSERKNLLGSIEHYYDTINATAAAIADHHEKQKFLKVLYENFYKVYNPKAADRLGVVYTPNEIVKFMIESTTYLLHKHFGKTLSDKNVDILDPATGTGTFISDIIDHIPKQHLAYKYKHELHANEVAILPYYISNLNIEFTFKQKMGYYEEFTNSCFVDTLDNIGALSYAGKQHSLFGFSSENAERIKKQNAKKISVIIGNPPYNAKQANYNYQNSNRAYEAVDKRIKETYIKQGSAQNQIVLYDMYTRFLRWATDRIDKNGVIAFVSNNSFIDSKSYDGFRKVIADEFNEIWVVNLKGNARTSGERRRQEGGNIFSDLIRVGVAIYFLVKNEKKERFKVFYNSIEDYVKADEKKEYLHNKNISDLTFQQLIPDKNNNWINQSENEWEELIPLVDKDTKSGKSEKAIFKLYSRGIATQRDEWVYDFSKEDLKEKIKFFTAVYEETRLNKDSKEKQKIKWDRELNKYLDRNIEKKFNQDKIIDSLYRPYFKQDFYFDRHYNGMTYQWFDILRIEEQNKFVIVPGLSSPKDFFLLSSNIIVDLNCLPAGCQCLPLYRYTSTGQRIDNITDWGLQQFTDYYKNENITKIDLFHYTYAVLHNPAYRKKYELNLKREFPRIPFYDDFFQWRNWGKQLMDLHINYETVQPYELTQHNYETKTETKKQKEFFTKAEEPEVLYARQPKIKVKLKTDKASGIIEIDDLTLLRGVPKEAWEYKLGNRSALEWILDQYKEKKPTDPTIAEKFNIYKFADYKEKVIDLLKRVCTVSVETMKIVREMEMINKQQ